MKICPSLTSRRARTTNHAAKTCNIATIAALAISAALLSGCAGGGIGSSGQSGQAEFKTASDQTAGQKRSSIRLQLAAGYYQSGQYDVALDEIKKALEADPGNGELYGVRALIYMGMKEPELANDNFQRGLQLAPRSADINSNYALYLCQNGKGAQAFAYFDAALAVRNYSAPGKVLNNAGACALQLKDYATAERYLMQAVHLTPDLPATNVNLARLYLQRADYTQAGYYINRVSKLTKIESLTADVLWLAIKVQHKLGDKSAEDGWATQLRRHQARSPEYAAYQRGAFDE